LIEQYYWGFPFPAHPRPAIGRPGVKFLQDALKNRDTEAEVRLRAKQILEQIAQKERFGE